MNYSNYFVSRSLVNELKRWGGQLILISGASCSGKTSIAESLPYPIVPTITTRSLRENENNIRSVSDNKFERFYENKAFATIVKYPNRSYGVLRSEFRKLLKKHRRLVMVVSPVMYKIISKRYNNTIGIYVDTPEDIILERMAKRDGLLESSRVKSIKQNNKSKHLYPIIIKNDSWLWRSCLTIHYKILLYQISSKIRSKVEMFSIRKDI